MANRLYIEYTKPGPMELYPEYRFWLISVIEGIHTLEGKFKSQEEAEERKKELEEAWED